MTIQNNLFIDGEFVDAESKSRIPVLNPHDNSLITEVAEAQKADIDRAVDAARKALPAWSKMAAADRGRLLLKLAEAIEANADELPSWNRSIPAIRCAIHAAWTWCAPR